MSSRNVAPFSYVIDEREISQKVGCEVSPLRVFTLAGLGIDQEIFLSELRPTFSVLHLDPYDAKRNKIEFLKRRFPHETGLLDHFLADYYADRVDLADIFNLIFQLSPKDAREFDRIGMTGRRKRSIARFILTEIVPPDGWEVERISADRFRQNVDGGDPRALQRVFREAPLFLIAGFGILQLLKCLATMVQECTGAQRVQITMHQMFVFADLMESGDNAPEGVHQDGSDYVVSALVIERAGVLGGESIVYGPDKETVYLRRMLEAGEGIFQEDRTLWHDITPIREDPSIPPSYGHRSILGFDIDIIG